MDQIELFLENKNWAVVGVSPNKFKFGYKIWKTLKKNGYNVFMINPFYDEIEGERVFKNLSEVEETIDVLSIVVPPNTTIDYLKEAIDLGIKNIWFQPDTFNEEILKIGKDSKLNIISDDCVLKVLLQKSL